MAAAETRQKAMIVGACPKAMLRFRGALIGELATQGYEVVCVAPQADAATERGLAAHGMTRFAAAPLDRAGMNPLRDLAALSALYKIMARERPDTVLTYNIKPIVYGTLAAWFAGVKRRIAMVEGLGYAYTPGPELKRRVARVLSNLLYRIPTKLAHCVVVLNEDDRAFFAQKFMRGREQDLHVLPGIGVDLTEFKPEPLPSGPITFVMISRLLKDKGVYEFAEAARLVKRQHPEARFILVGGTDANPTSVKPAELEAWAREGRLEYVGEVSDVRRWLKQSHVFVLPSYREGMSRSIMEALAMGRPCIVSDVPGCRQLVERGRTGLLVPPKDAAALAHAMTMLAANSDVLQAWSVFARRSAMDRFDAGLAARLLAAIVQPSNAEQTTTRHSFSDARHTHPR